MIRDEGYVKYASDWKPGGALAGPSIDSLVRWRRPLYRAGLIGYSAADEVGYGNLSVRVSDTRQFIISGTQTGHLPETDGSHYALVTDYDIEANSVRCTGPVQASSEALTHAAIYELDGEIKAVVHAHDDTLWQALKGRWPTTAGDIAYGTPEMARDFARLYRDTDFAAVGTAVMAGHAGGIVSVGASLAEAARRLLDLADRDSWPG